MNLFLKQLLFVGLALGISFAAEAETAGSQPTAVASVAIQVVLVKIESYSDFKEIRSALQSLEGVYEVSVRSEAPDLLTLGVEYSGKPDQITQRLRDTFKRYTITQKLLPTGVTEINVAKGG